MKNGKQHTNERDDNRAGLRLKMERTEERNAKITKSQISAKRQASALATLGSKPLAWGSPKDAKN